MQDSVSVAIADSLYQLAHESLDDILSKSHSLGYSLHVFLKIKVQILKDKVKLASLSLLIAMVFVDNVVESDNVGVGHLLQEGNLTNGRARNSFIFNLQANLLQGDQSIVVVLVASFVDNTIGT